MSLFAADTTVTKRISTLLRPGHKTGYLQIPDVSDMAAAVFIWGLKDLPHQMAALRPRGLELEPPSLMNINEEL